MEKVAKILTIIGSVIGIIITLMFIGFGIGSLVMSLPDNMELIKKGIEDGVINVNIPGTIDEKVVYAQKIFVLAAIIFLVYSLIFVVSVVFGFISAFSSKQGYTITAMVFAVLTMNTFSIIGLIFKIVSFGENKEAN